MKTNKFYFFGDDQPPISYRPGTSDEGILNEVLIRQTAYRFPVMKDAKLCFDFGGNIGVTAVLMARIYPEAIIHTFEPQEENFLLLRQNTIDYKNIIAHNYGLGATGGKKYLFPSDDPKNMGGFSTTIRHGEPATIRVWGIKNVCDDLGTPDLVKIDIEGAEGEVLRNFPRLEKVRWIAGELHSQDADYLLLHVLNTHFKLALARGFDDKIWTFHAVNKAWTDFGRDPALKPSE